MIFFKRSKNQNNNKNTSVPKVHTIKNARWRCLFVFSSVSDGWLRWRRRRRRWRWRWLWIVINYHSVKASSFLLLLLFDFLRSMIYQQPNEWMYIVCACVYVCVSTCVILLSIYIMNIWQNFAWTLEKICGEDNNKMAQKKSGFYGKSQEINDETTTANQRN